MNVLDVFYLSDWDLLASPGNPACTGVLTLHEITASRHKECMIMNIIQIAKSNEILKNIINCINKFNDLVHYHIFFILLLLLNFCNQCLIKIIFLPNLKNVMLQQKECKIHFDDKNDPKLPFPNTSRKIFLRKQPHAFFLYIHFTCTAKNPEI